VKTRMVDISSSAMGKWARPATVDGGARWLRLFSAGRADKYRGGRACAYVRVLGAPPTA